MGFIQSIVGSNTGAGYQAGGIQQGQINNAQTQVTNTQDQQNALLQALAGQGGIQNQNQALQAMQGTAGQYQDLANGTGPNPAQAQLAQNTAQNVAQTGALMAGQRGAAQNVGMLARQAGQQGAATQQQAVGQAATLGAQQQIAGLQGLSGVQSNIANLATQQVGQQQQAAQAASQAALSNQSNVYGLQSNINTTNAGVAAGNQKAQAGLIGGVLGSVGAGSNGISQNNSASGGYIQADTSPLGGHVESLADGGQAGQVITPNAASNMPMQQPQGPQSYLGRTLSGSQMGQGTLNQDTGTSGQKSGAALYQIGKAAYQGGKSLYSYLFQRGVPNATTADAVDTNAVDSTTGSSGTQIASADASSAGADAAGAGAADAGAGEGADLLLAADGGQIQPGYVDKQPDPSTIGGTLENVMSYLAGGGKVADARQRLVDVMVSPGEKIVPPKEVQKCAQGGRPQMKTVPGKAEVSGDSLKNDKVATKLPAGSIVVKRTRANNNPEGFIKEVLSKRKGSK